MNNIKKITLSLTLYFMCSTAMVQAQITNDKNQGATQNENCIKLKKHFKVRLNRALKVHKVLHQTLRSNQLIDKYNRHMNILFGNLDREAGLMEKLIVDSKEDGCGELGVMRSSVVSIKKIHNKHTVEKTFSCYNCKELHTMRVLKGKINKIVCWNCNLSRNYFTVSDDKMEMQHGDRLNEDIVNNYYKIVIVF